MLPHDLTGNAPGTVEMRSFFVTLAPFGWKLPQHSAAKAVLHGARTTEIGQKHCVFDDAAPVGTATGKTQRLGLFLPHRRGMQRNNGAWIPANLRHADRCWTTAGVRCSIWGQELLPEPSHIGRGSDGSRLTRPYARRGPCPNLMLPPSSGSHLLLVGCLQIANFKRRGGGALADTHPPKIRPHLPKMMPRLAGCRKPPTLLELKRQRKDVGHVVWQRECHRWWVYAHSSMRHQVSTLWGLNSVGGGGGGTRQYERKGPAGIGSALGPGAIHWQDAHRYVTDTVGVGAGVLLRC